MPRLSDTMTEGTIARWVKHPGESVQKGEILAEIETDKATMELEAYEGGVVEQVMVEEGQTVAIGQPIALIGAGDGSRAAAEPAEQEAAPPAKARTPEPSGEAAPPADSGGAAQTSSAAATLTADAIAPGEETRAAQPTVGQGTGQSGRAPDVETVQAKAATDGAARQRAPEDEDEVRASPMARRIARERGIDLHTIEGSGPGGRVIRADVESAGVAAAANGAAATPAVSAPAPEAPAEPAPARLAPSQAPSPSRPPAQPAAVQGGPEQEVEEIPLSNIRRVTGRRMVESVQSAPHFFLTSVVDVTELVELRSEINGRLEKAGDETKVSLNDLIVKACALALQAMPDANVSFDGDKILRKKRIHIGVAVAIENGLIVPVLRDADHKSVSQLAREGKALIAKARAGKLAPTEYTGGTFTVSNLGMFGVEHFTAVINPPEAAILAVGASAAEPVVVDGKVEVRERMRLTLSVDHRALDGANGARFLQVLKGFLEAPMRILI